MTINDIFKEICDERLYHREKWSDFDLVWSPGDWLLILEGLVNKAKNDRAFLPNAQDDHVYAKNVMQIASVAVAALEHSPTKAPQRYPK